jgi:hypothetical protein
MYASQPSTTAIDTSSFFLLCSRSSFSSALGSPTEPPADDGNEADVGASAVVEAEVGDGGLDVPGVGVADAGKAAAGGGGTYERNKPGNKAEKMDESAALPAKKNPTSSPTAAAFRVIGRISRAINRRMTSAAAIAKPARCTVPCSELRIMVKSGSIFDMTDGPACDRSPLLSCMNCSRMICSAGAGSSSSKSSTTMIDEDGSAESTVIARDEDGSDGDDGDCKPRGG